MSAQQVVTVNVLDVNDNKPVLTTKDASVCVKTLDPVILKAEDADGDPFAEPFTFTLEKPTKYPNWKLDPIDGTDGNLLRSSSRVGWMAEWMNGWIDGGVTLLSLISFCFLFIRCRKIRSAVPAEGPNQRNDLQPPHQYYRQRRHGRDTANDR